MQLKYAHRDRNPGWVNGPSRFQWITRTLTTLLLNCKNNSLFERLQVFSTSKSLPPTITEKWRKPTFCPLHFNEDCDVWLRERSWKKFKFTGIVPSTISADAAISEVLLYSITDWLSHPNSSKVKFKVLQHCLITSTHVLGLYNLSQYCTWGLCFLISWSFIKHDGWFSSKVRLIRKALESLAIFRARNLIFLENHYPLRGLTLLGGCLTLASDLFPVNV